MTKSEYARAAKKHTLEWELYHVPYGYVMDGGEYLERDSADGGDEERKTRSKGKRKNTKKNGGEKGKTKW